MTATIHDLFDGDRRHGDPDDHGGLHGLIAGAISRLGNDLYRARDQVALYAFLQAVGVDVIACPWWLDDVLGGPPDDERTIKLADVDRWTLTVCEPDAQVALSFVPFDYRLTHAQVDWVINDLGVIMSAAARDRVASLGMAPEQEGTA
jgi:hypothetical protein